MSLPKTAQDERKIVPVPAVNGALFNERGEVLLTRRSAKVREPGKWCLPGGHVEVDETLAEAIIREIQEEVGVRVKRFELSGIYSDPKITMTPVLSEGFRVQFVVAVFRITEFEGDIKSNEEVDDWGWYTPSNLPAPMLISHPIRVEDAFSKMGPYVR